MGAENNPQRPAVPWAVIIVILALVVLGVAYAVFQPSFGPSRPQPTQTTCIQVPELTTDAERKPALDVAAKLERLKIDANLQAQFTEVSKTTFQTVPEKQMGLLLLLRAVDCYLQHADTPEKVETIKLLAPQLIATAREMWAASHGLKGTQPDRLSVKEIAILEKDPLGSQILAKFEKHGITQ
jgi:hypothetical protein